MAAVEMSGSKKGQAEGEVSVWSIHIRTNDGINNTNGLSNSISTTKYSLVSWLPKSLWEQFRRIANIYFLVISALMLIGTYATYLFVSPLDPFSTVMTLVFVLMVTSIKEGYEDFQRYRSDRDENTRMVTLVRFDANGVESESLVETQTLKAGDIVKMTGTTQVPADLLLLLTSNHADGNQCYVETANIDGETNLKLRVAPAPLAPLLNNGVLSSKLVTGHLEFEPPNKNIHNFIGAYYLQELADPISLSADNILLRGSLFSNTDWAYGIAVYTGQETKVQMNNRLAPSKLSKLEGYLNLAIMIIFLCQISLVSASVISIYAMGFNVNGKLPYIFPDDSGSTSILPLWLEQWFVFFLLYNNFIPISLYVTIELVNLGQGFFIGSDLKMYDDVLDMPCVVRSSNLAQELGQVSNIFSDKTGTLTRNEMKFVNFVLGGDLFEIPWTKEPSGPLKAKLVSKDRLLSDFLHCMTVCHTVVREKDGTYRAESPDELALIEGVGRFDCGLVERSTGGIIVTVAGQRQTYDILAVNAFNSDRKRMSILVRDFESGEYILYCKGADNIMMPLCSMSNSDIARADKALMDLANLGLRTLCVAQKKMNAESANAWLAKYRAASASLVDRAEKLVEVGGEIEEGMEFLGLTAIEDRLQDEVPEVIADLARAGIVLWMLTGDKQETAINIGRSCNLLMPDTKLFIITKQQSAEDYHNLLEATYNDIESHCNEGGLYIEGGAAVEIAFVMDGPSFKFFNETDMNERKWLLRIGKAVRAVIGCRLTPIQKQQVVGLVKHDTVPRAITLSIGDGANDVSMIREADVGVGIFGKEGRQAANNADFAIGQFKFLRRLLLVHGRWNYIRQSRVFLYSMHKNMVITLTLFWYSYYTAVSGTSLYESWIYTAFNFILGLPIIFFGMQDRDISDPFALEHPESYSTSRLNTYLTVPAIAKWIWNAVLYAIIICLVYYLAVRESFNTWGLYDAGTTVFAGLCMALQCKVAYLHHQWTWVQIFMMCLSVGGMLAWFAIIQDSYDDYYGVVDFCFSQGLYWFFGMFTGPLICLLLDFFGYNLMLFFRPTSEMYMRELEHKADFENDWLHNRSLSPFADSSSPMQSVSPAATESQRKRQGPVNSSLGEDGESGNQGVSRPQQRVDEEEFHV